MKNKPKRIKLNMASNKGFTMADVVIALIIFSIFTGTIGSFMYSSYKMNLQTKMTGAATNYAMQILEDIDKIAYEEVTNGMETKYIEKYAIPSGFTLSIDVSNYKEGDDVEDVIKKVRLTISYELAKDGRNIVIERMKIKEM